MKVIEVYEAFGWQLYKEDMHAYNVMKQCLTDSDEALAGIEISDEHRKALLLNINKKMATAPIKIRTVFKLNCYSFEGVLAIKEALIATKEKMVNDKFEIVFQMIVSPEYKAEVVTLDKTGGTAKLLEASGIIEKEIKARGGNFALVSPPETVGNDVKF